jgi:transcriptional regulator of acetoin/glycerol metabolism
MLTDLSPDVDIRTLDEVIEEYMLFAIRVCNGNIGKASRALGINRSTIYRRLKKVRDEQA